MDQKHVDNISALIHFMEGLNDPRFDMRMFSHDCNTPACALGWACSIPAFQKKGLSLTFLREKAGREITELTKELFGCFQEIFRGSLEAQIRTPQDWALHAREYLKRNGCEVTAPASDDFKHFMERVLTPVVIETQTH